VPAKTILDSIGNTPLVPLRNMRRRGIARVLLKLESFNPTGSLKDRIVDYILAAAERDGTLRAQHTVIDASSGNTGIALGVVAAVRGYKARIYMPETKSIERRRIMQALGIDIVDVEPTRTRTSGPEEAARDTDRSSTSTERQPGRCDALPRYWRVVTDARSRRSPLWPAPAMARWRRPLPARQGRAGAGRSVEPDS
jgi:cysteine synthase